MATFWRGGVVSGEHALFLLLTFRRMMHQTLGSETLTCVCLGLTAQDAAALKDAVLLLGGVGGGTCISAGVRQTGHFCTGDAPAYAAPGVLQIAALWGQGVQTPDDTLQHHRGCGRGLHAAGDSRRGESPFLSRRVCLPRGLPHSGHLFTILKTVPQSNSSQISGATFPSTIETQGFSLQHVAFCVCMFSLIYGAFYLSKARMIPGGRDRQ